MALESDIENLARDEAEKLGWASIKLNLRGNKGWPDVMFLKDGVVVFIEFKQPGESPDILQQRKLAKLKELGFIADWSDSVKFALRMLENALEP